MLQLIIGNKNYSSWSMRAWVLLTQARIPFTERKLRFDSFSPDSAFKQAITAIHPAGQVPVLIDGELVVADTLAIAEYLAERHPEAQLWPQDRNLRAQARSAVAQTHAGFGNLRSALPMNIEADLPDIGEQLLDSNEGLRADLARLFALWRDLLGQSGGPLLLGQFSIADAFFAPVVMRLLSYHIPVPDDLQAYVQAVWQLPSVQAWVDDALAEHDFIAFEEPYRRMPGA